MLLARVLDTQYQHYNETIPKVFMEEIPLLLCKLKSSKKHKRGVFRFFLFMAVVGKASEAISAFIRHRKSKALYKALIIMRKKWVFQITRLEYLDKAMTLYGTENTSSIDEIMHAINQLHIFFSKQEGIFNGKQAYWYKDYLWQNCPNGS